MFPSTIAVLPNPNPSDRLNNPSHSALHQSENAEIVAIETFVGTTSASTLGTLIYDIRSPSSNGGGHIQAANTGGTGQTSFTKGDLLIAQSASVLSKLAVGGDGNFLVADSAQATGIKWGVGLNPTVRVYGSSVISGAGGTSILGIWVKPATLSYAVVEVLGAGSGGGGTTTANVSSGGGAGAGYTRKIFSAASLPTAASIIGGIGGAAGAGTGGTGGTGGTSYFGSVLNATGATGGTTGGIGGTPGVGVGGDIAIAGGTGANGASSANPIGGIGGNSFYGYGGNGGNQANGGNATGYGSGGGGASSGGPDQSGGIGANGLIIITEY